MLNKEISLIKQVLAEAGDGRSVTDIARDWGVGTINHTPILQPDRPRTNKNVDSRYPQFFEADGPTEETLDGDALSAF